MDALIFAIALGFKSRLIRWKHTNVAAIVILLMPSSIDPPSCFKWLEIDTDKVLIELTFRSFVSGLSMIQKVNRVPTNPIARENWRLNHNLIQGIPLAKVNRSRVIALHHRHLLCIINLSVGNKRQPFQFDRARNVVDNLQFLNQSCSVTCTP